MIINSESVKVHGNIINGQECFSDEKIPVYDKYTQEMIGQICGAGHQMVRRAVENAKHTFHAGILTPTKRAEILLNTAELLKEHKEAMARLLVQEVGRTIKDCRTEIDRAVTTFTISAEEAKRIAGHCVPIQGQSGNENRLAFTIRKPVGVIGAITPFNMPINLTAHKVGPAIAAGNTVVLKPAERTPLTVMKLVNLIKQSGLPDGYLNVVHGFGKTTGQYLITDERINMLTFTGSVPVGRYIKQASGIKKVALELGSNSPTIIHHDVERLTEIAALCAMRGFSTTNGQACISVQRLYVHEHIVDQFADLLVKAAGRMTVGNPNDEATDIGPLISEQEAVRVETWVEEARNAGAHVLCGGRRDGGFYHPTVLTNVDHKQKVMCQEMFGPVICVIPYKTIDEVIRHANDTPFGLQAGIFTKDLNVAMKAVNELDYGGVMVNDVSTYRSDIMPYGGLKDSGLGKEGPRYAIEEMTDERVIVFNM